MEKEKSFRYLLSGGKNRSGFITRKSVSVPVQTGIKAIDAVIPVGLGKEN